MLKAGSVPTSRSDEPVDHLFHSHQSPRVKAPWLVESCYVLPVSPRLMAAWLSETIKIFQPVVRGINGEWRKWHIEELCNLYASLNIFRKECYYSNWSTKEWYEQNKQHTWQMKILFMKLEGKRSHGRPRHWQKKIKMHLTEFGHENVEWFNLLRIGFSANFYKEPV